MTPDDGRTDPEHGHQWERAARAHLSQSDHDTDLGVQLSKDAQKVVKGEMSEAEFHEKHHEAMIEEFGADNRRIDVNEGAK